MNRGDSFGLMLTNALAQVNTMPSRTMVERQRRAESLHAAIRAWKMQATGRAEAS